MKKELCDGFERFAQAFVVTYWSTVKEGRFRMPPEEPVQETLEELLAVVSFTAERRQIVMSTLHGDCWSFGFKLKGIEWMLTKATTGGKKKKSQIDLLGPVYGPQFSPFLTFVLNQAIKNSEQGVPPKSDRAAG